MEVENSISYTDINVAIEHFLMNLKQQIADICGVDILQVNLIFVIRSDGSLARIEVLPLNEFIKENVNLSVVLGDSREKTMFMRLKTLLEKNNLKFDDVLHSDNWTSNNTREIKNLVKYLQPKGYLQHA